MSKARDNVEKLRGVSAVSTKYTPLKRQAAFWLKETSFAISTDMASEMTAAELVAVEAFRSELLDVYKGTAGVLPVLSTDAENGFEKTFTDLSIYNP